MNMLIERIRKEIKACEKAGTKRSKIARATGINEAALSRIVYGGDCKTVTADLLLSYFGLTIEPKNKGKRNAR